MTFALWKGWSPIRPSPNRVKRDQSEGLRPRLRSHRFLCGLMTAAS